MPQLDVTTSLTYHLTWLLPGSDAREATYLAPAGATEDESDGDKSKPDMHIQPHTAHTLSFSVIAFGYQPVRTD